MSCYEVCGCAVLSCVSVCVLRSKPVRYSFLPCSVSQCVPGLIPLLWRRLMRMGREGKGKEGKGRQGKENKEEEEKEEEGGR